jgi:hypothetical protein
MACTEYEADLRLTAALNGTEYQGPTSYWAELVTDTPDRTTDGTPSTLGRIEIVCATDVTNNGDGTGDNAVALTWTAPGADLPECSYIELWDDETVGERRFYELLSSPVTPLSGQDVTIPIGQFTWTEV